MGTQFSWFYDIVLIAIIVGFTFRGFKKGFVSTVVGLAAVIVAFIVGLILSGLLASAIYNGVIRKNAVNYIEQNIGSIAGTESFAMLPSLDLSKIMLNETDNNDEIVRSFPLSEIDATPDHVGNIDIDLSNVDLSNTGIAELDLELFGLTAEELASVNAGRAVITAAELTDSDFETLVLAKVLANTMQNSAEYDEIADAAVAVGSFAPQLSGSGTAGEAVTRAIAALIESEAGGSVSGALLDNIIAPLIIVPLRTLIFFILFAIICIVMSIIAKKMEIVNKIPLIGTVNSVLGGTIGLVKALVIVFLVCIGLNILITVTGNAIIFINTMTINESAIFKHIYNFNFI
jgi:hypothetical protein